MMLDKFIIPFFFSLVLVDFLACSHARAEQGFDCIGINSSEEILVHEQAYKASLKAQRDKDLGCLEYVKAGFLIYQQELQALVVKRKIRLDHFLLVSLTERHPEKICQKGHFQYGLMEIAEWQRSQLDDWKPRNKSRFVTVVMSFDSKNSGVMRSGFLRIDKNSSRLPMRIEKLVREPFISNCGDRNLSSKK